MRRAWRPSRSFDWHKSRTAVNVSTPADRSGSGASDVQRRRVVVTGTGLVTCLGVGVQHVWQRLVRGESGISGLVGPDYDKIPCKVAGVVPRGAGPGELDLDAVIPKSEQRSMSSASCFAVVAADEAMKQAELKLETEEEALRAGVAVGMGMVSLGEIADTGALLKQKYSRVSPHFIPKILINMAAGHISLKHNLKGPNHSVSTACTTGVHAIGDAFRFIQHGDADVMVCGGAEASVEPLPIAGFARMRALSTNFNDNPTAASRPFDKARDGFVMSEGAGVLVLEELDHALSRKAPILGEILGYGLSGDANHITAPSTDGDGAFRCMSAALRHLSITSDMIGYVNAHATSTPLGDVAECRAISRLLGSGSEVDFSVSSTKGAVGHLLGAAGSVEAIFTLLACQTGTIPPTLNCENLDEEIELDVVPLHAKQWKDKTDLSAKQRFALTNSFGFGGTNASLCVSNFVA